jgi:hypothetical protein
MDRTSFQKLLTTTCLLLLVCLGGHLDAQTHQVIINELMQSNVDALFYRKDFPDSWFEVYNTTGKKINLRGWSIGVTNDYAKSYNLFHFRELPAYGHILYYCDKKDDGWEHTDFRLESTKAGALYLWNAEGVLIDSVAYDEMPAPNIAWGRVTDGADEWQYEVTPTPGEPNESRGSDFIMPDPVFSHTGRLLAAGEMLTLTIAFPDVALPSDTRLYVTLDGSAPTKASASYSKEEVCRFLITETTVVRARLISDYALASLPVTHSYIRHPRLTQLPVFSLSTDSKYLYDEEIGMMVGDDFDGNCFKGWRRPFNIEFFEQNVPDTALINQIGEAGMHGAGSLRRHQKAMNLYTNKRWQKKRFKSSTFFPHKPFIKKTKTFCLRNSGTRCLDSRIDDGFVQLLFANHIDSLQYLDYRPCIVYIDGKYNGVMDIRERANNTWASNNLGLEEDSISEIEAFYTKVAEYDDVRQLIDDPNSKYEEFAQLFDMSLFLNYLCCEAYSSNRTFAHTNVYMWYDRSESRKVLHPLLKDLDDFAGGGDNWNWLNFITLTGSESNYDEKPEHRRIFARLFDMPEFRNPFIDRMMVYLGDFCKPSVAVPMINEMRAAIEDEIEATFVFIDEGATYQDFANRIEQQLIPFCQKRPLIQSQQLASRFNLGKVIPLTVVANVNNGGSVLDVPVRMNDIRLTEGNFDGYCFSNHSFRVNSGSSNFHWQLVITFSDGSWQTRNYSQSEITIRPELLSSNIASLTLVPFVVSGAGIEATIVEDNVSSFYDLFGRRIQQPLSGRVMIQKGKKIITY